MESKIRVIRPSCGHLAHFSCLRERLEQRVTNEPWVCPVCYSNVSELYSCLYDVQSRQVCLLSFRMSYIPADPLTKQIRRGDFVLICRRASTSPRPLFYEYNYARVQMQDREYCVLISFRANGEQRDILWRMGFGLLESQPRQV